MTQTLITKDRESYIQEKQFDKDRFYKFVMELYEDTKEKEKIEINDIKEIYETVISNVLSRERVEASRLFDYIIRESNGKISQKNPEFTKFSASVFRRKLYKQASKNRGFDYHNGYGDYYSLVKKLTEEGKYDISLIKQYSEDELKKIGSLINKDKDKLFDYSGLQLLSLNYLVKADDLTVLELPQERLLTTVTYLMKDEPKEKRISLIEEGYYALSNHLIGMSTPTLKNSGVPHGSLSSCHIVTMSDDLKNIFDATTQVARFSQNGSGLGIFLGFLRANGSWIRGIKGASSGVVHPSRLQSVVAEYVNQLGTRKAGIAVYLPVWHGDIFDFLDMRLKTGTQEKRAHSIKTAVTIPDEFMRRLTKNELFTVFDPYEVKKKLGFDLNRMYDKQRLLDGEEPNPQDHEFTYYYRLAENSNLELKKTVKATEIYKSIFISRKTSGTPYMYWTDTAARMNPNAHAGMPVGSNLCSEIVQNNSSDTHVSEELDEQGFVITKTKGEGLVSCNLSSLVLHNTHNLNNKEFQRVVDIQFRMLDNVISLNRTVVPQATHTNNLYRSVGAGALGHVTLLTNEGISWESDDASKFTGEVFKRYLKAQIEASHKLAKEKGDYPLFEGSDWETGEFFDKRGLVSDEWKEYREMAEAGMRNSYLSAVAPTASNSIITNGSPSLDPLYDVIYTENKSGVNVTIVPPNYNNQTKWFYKSGFEMDEMWAINIVAAAQKYVDQAISHNMHVPEKIKGSELLRLDVGAWKKGLKTIYYTHTQDGELPEDCVMCEG